MTNDVVQPFSTSDYKGDTWQVDYVRFFGWVDDREPPYRPTLVVAVSAETGLVGSSDLVHPADVEPELALGALDSLEELMGRRPAVIEISDPDLASALKESLAGDEVTVLCRDELPLLAESVEEMGRQTSDKAPFDAAHTIPGVTIDQLRAFAEAAEEFFEASPWRYLGSEDIIEIEAPRPTPNVRFVSVLSAHGELGLGLAERRPLLDGDDDAPDDGWSGIAHDAVWSVTFFAPWELPIAEHDLWIAEDLPTGPEDSIPAAIQFGPKRRVRRASPKMLGFFEGLFRALADTTEDELDSGAWRKLVSTSQGKLSLGLSLPDVLDPPQPSGDEPAPFNPLRMGMTMDGIRDLLAGMEFESEEETRAFLEAEVMGGPIPGPAIAGPKDDARELALKAMDTQGRPGIALARRALELDPDSTIAHLALAVNTRDRVTAVERFRRAVEVAERELGPEIFRDDAGEFWLIGKTRPYMEAVKGLADSLWIKGQRHEAVEHYTELLRLNPNDNQGIRDRLAPALLALGEDGEALKLLETFADDPASAPAFNRALAVFRMKRAGDEAGELLGRAIETNPHVPDLLLGRTEIPDILPDGYSLGSVEEAVFYFLETEEVWSATPGALDWLTDAIGD